MKMIESDASNPNGGLQVQFYSRLVENEFQSKTQQRSIFEPFDFIKIWTPGNVLNIIDTFVREEHKQRFPRQWMAYQNRGDKDAAMTGTPITEWTRVSREQAEELRGLKFFTVEAVAHASDAQLQGIGMIAGTSAFAFRDDAKRFLSVAEAAAKLSEADERVAAANTEMERIRKEAEERIAKMEARMDALLAMAEANTAPTEDKKPTSGEKPPTISLPKKAA